MIGITAADALTGIRFEGQITGVSGNVQIEKLSGTNTWQLINASTIGSDGYYYIPGPTNKTYKYVDPKAGTYRMLINGNEVDSKVITDGEWINDNSGILWSYRWNYTEPTHVPEFSTIALPVATILGLLFFFNCKRRKTKKKD